MPVPRFVGAISEILSLSGTSQATATASPEVRRNTGFASVSAIGADIWVTAGPEPVAIAGQYGFALPAGQTRDFAVEPGDKIAVIQL